jgi:hypothetical protein
MINVSNPKVISDSGIVLNDNKKCKVCDNPPKDHFDRFCISRTGRCVKDQRKFEDKPENDPENKCFRFDYTFTEKSWTDIYAKTEQAARDIWDEEWSGDYELDDVTEIERATSD